LASRRHPTVNGHDLADRVNLLRKIRGFWRNLRRRQRINRVVRIESMSQLPKRLKSHLYIVGGAKPKWAILACPCRCGDRIDVNLMATRQPSWQLSTNGGEVSLHPSLWMPKEKCGSHFWLRANRIDWVP
jgi:hypothetical protein